MPSPSQSGFTSRAFTWPQWAETLADEIARAGAPDEHDTGESYYEDWLAALERLVAESGSASTDELHLTRESWRRAARRTPHGSPIELTSDDYLT